MKKLAVVLCSMALAGCASMPGSPAFKSDVRDAAAGALLVGGAFQIGAGVMTGNPIPIATGAATVLAAAAVAAKDVDPYRGTIVIRNPEPLPHVVRLAYLSRGMTDETLARLGRALEARGWEVHGGIGRPPDSTLFEIAEFKGRNILSVFRPDGALARAEVAGGRIDVALDRALSELAFRP